MTTEIKTTNVVVIQVAPAVTASVSRVFSENGNKGANNSLVNNQYDGPSNDASIQRDRSTCDEGSTNTLAEIDREVTLVDVGGSNDTSSNDAPPVEGKIKGSGSSGDKEFINTLAEIHRELTSVDVGGGKNDRNSINQVQTICVVDENQANYRHNVPTGGMSPKGVESLRLLKGLMTNDEESQISGYYAVLGIMGIPLGCLLSSALTIVPQQNAIEKPSYWYEFPIIVSIGFGISLSTWSWLGVIHWMNTDVIKNWKPLLSMSLVCSGTYLIVAILCYVLWVVILKYNHPMPFNLHICGTVAYFAMIGNLWSHFPQSCRVESIFRKQFGYFLVAQMLGNVNTWTYLAVALLFGVVSNDYQWILALILPIIREILQFLLSRVCYRSAQCNDSTVAISSWCTVATRQALFIAVQMSSVANNITSYLILAVDFTLNMILCFKIISRYKKNNNHVDGTIMMDAQELVLNEKIEIVIPIAYLLCFLMARYGPNPAILIGISGFDVVKTMKSMAVMFLIDLCSGILSAILLYTMCGISLYKVYLHSQKELGLWMIVVEAYMIYEVRHFN